MKKNTRKNFQRGIKALGGFAFFTLVMVFVCPSAFSEPLPKQTSPTLKMTGLRVEASKQTSPALKMTGLRAEASKQTSPTLKMTGMRDLVQEKKVPPAIDFVNKKVIGCLSCICLCLCVSLSV